MTMTHSLKMVQREVDIWTCGPELWGHDPSKKHRKSGEVLSATGSTRSQEALCSDSTLRTVHGHQQEDREVTDGKLSN